MEKSPIVKIAKKVCPAVITIIISKDLPKIEGYYLLPFRGKELIFPRLKKEKELRKIGGGSGFIVSPDGYVLTANHVVGDPDAKYTIIIDPKHKYPAKVLARDPLADVAILKIDGKNFPYLELGDSNKIELGETVIAVGNPLGEFEDTISAGIISGLSRRITAYGGLLSKATSLRGLIQTDAAINPGNSGGPLVNMEGKAIAINNAMVMGAQNIGFAVPINYAKKDLEEVKKYGKVKKPFLGVRYIILNKALSQAQKLPVNYGALVIRESLGENPIVKGSAAEKAGIKEYDIILKADGKKITKDYTLADVLSKHEVGDTITLEVLRGKKKINLKAKLQERK